MNKTINDLRDTLFDTLAGLQDGSVDVEKARAINEVGKTLIDSAKVEVDYLRATGGGESSFIESAVGAENLPPGVTGITQHRIR